jgi:hypothetical protein
VTKLYLEPVGFFSYARQDDELSGQKLTRLRKAIKAELQLHYGRRTIKLFQDTSTIPHGARWERETLAALNKSTFFIPIITPGFIQSEWCCRETMIFLERERKLIETYPDLPPLSRIFPIYYRKIRENAAYDAEALSELNKRQMCDFQELRDKDADSEIVNQTISEFAASICDLLFLEVEAPPTPEEIAHREARAAAERKREEQALKAEAVEARRREREAAAREKAEKEEAEKEEARRREEEEAVRAAASAAAQREADAERQARRDAAERAEQERERAAAEAAARESAREIAEAALAAEKARIAFEAAERQRAAAIAEARERQERAVAEAVERERRTKEAAERTRLAVQSAKTALGPEGAGSHDPGNHSDAFADDRDPPGFSSFFMFGVSALLVLTVLGGTCAYFRALIE